MAWPTAPGQIAAPLAGFCWRRHLELAHVKCSHPPQSLWPDLEMCCARGADTSSQGEKKDTKRATSCEVALSKRLGWGMLNQAVNYLILNKNGQFRKFQYA